jgi:hypothetical protein
MVLGVVSNLVSQVLRAYIAPDNQTHVDFFIGQVKSWLVSDIMEEVSAIATLSLPGI